MAIFDTAILISALAGERWAESAIERYSKDGISTTSLNRYELLKGASYRTEAENVAVAQLLERAVICELDGIAVSRASQLFDELKKKGKTIDEMDILIAAIAMSRDDVLVVSDRHFDSIRYKRLVNVARR